MHRAVIWGPNVGGANNARGHRQATLEDVETGA